MKINQNNINNINNLNKLKNYNVNKEIENKPTVNKNSKSDSVNISKEALQMLNNKEVDNKQTEKIENIKKLINEGKYNIDPEKLAQKIIDFEYKF